jgi:hypothetical protein
MFLRFRRYERVGRGEVPWHLKRRFREVWNEKWSVQVALVIEIDSPAFTTCPLLTTRWQTTRRPRAHRAFR